MADISPDISLEFYEGINRWFEWENRITAMSSFQMLDRYKASKSTNKYDRFVGFLKEWAFERMKSAEKRPNPNKIGLIDGFDIKDENNDVIKNMQEESFAMLSFEKKDKNAVAQTLDERVDDPDKFWEAAIASSGNKKINGAMPKIKGDNAKPVYDLFMPAYRALKDRFEKRSIFQWITNHAQYTAERDSIKALEGIMRSLTGDSLEKVTEKLAEMRQRMPERDRTKCLLAETKRLDELEAAKNLNKEQVKTQNKTLVEQIVVKEIMEENKVSISERVVKSDAKKLEKDIT